MSMFIHTLANEPSLGLYHVNVHINNHVSRAISMKKSLDSRTKKMDALTYDLEQNRTILLEYGTIHCL